MENTIYQKLAAIQSELNVPKSQYNKFGNYNYRKAEDILDAVKPVAKKHGCVVKCTDEIALVGDRYYVKATAMLIDVETSNNVMAVAYAREEDEKKGMDGSQVTGASSSYARKYALGGLFCLDDNQDSDATNTGGGTAPKKPAPAPAPAKTTPAKSAAAPAKEAPKPAPVKERIKGLTETQYSKYVEMAAKNIPTSDGKPVRDALVSHLAPTTAQLKQFDDDVFLYQVHNGIA